MKKGIKKTNQKKPSEIQGSASLEVSYNDIFDTLVEGYGKKDDKESKKKFTELFSRLLAQTIARHKCAEEYNILFLFDNTTLIKSDSDRIYQAIYSLERNKKPLLLILLSRGGEPGSAYLIGKLCRESCNNKFAISVPRYAKSAATLLACAADEIHMGSLSELGPIDPQINGMPALGLKSSIEHIADLVSKKPLSAEMFAKYLSYSIEPIQIGYYERAAKSAEQYAEKLLKSHKQKAGFVPEEIAFKLVHEYKDHGFVIDKVEARNIFGEEVIKGNSPEYDLGNDIYFEFSRIEEIADFLGFNFYFIGSLKSEPQFTRKIRPRGK